MTEENAKSGQVSLTQRSYGEGELRKPSDLALFVKKVLDLKGFVWFLHGVVRNTQDLSGSSLSWRRAHRKCGGGRPFIERAAKYLPAAYDGPCGGQCCMESGDAIRQLHCSALLLDRRGIRQASCVFVCRDSKNSKRWTGLERVSMRVVKSLQAVNKAITTLDLRQADSATGLLTSTFSLVALKLELNIGAVGIANREEN